MSNKKVGKVKKEDRFNKDPKESVFIEDFQKVMIDRMELNYEKKYTLENIAKIIRKETNRPPNSINTNITGGLLLSLKVEPEIYLKIQETLKRITGDFMPIDEFLHYLILYFLHTYSKAEIKKQLPFNQKYKGRSKAKLLRFNSRFRRFYKNIPKDLSIKSVV